MNYPIESIRADFPFLIKKQRYHRPPIYLDNAAACLQPQTVVESYAKKPALIDSDDFEAARHKIKTFINAARDQEIIFFRSATEAINVVAQAYGEANIKMGDEIVITAMEHCANIVPWQMLCYQTGAVLKTAPISLSGELIFSEFEKLLSDKTKLVCVVHVSNVLGTINPVKAIINAAHAKNIPVLLDGAQAIPHLKIDVQDMNCDFYVFLGHKLYGPTGVGVLYAKQALLDAMSIYQTCSNAAKLNFATTKSNLAEIETANIVDIVGLGFAIDYLNAIGVDEIVAYEAQLFNYATEEATKVEGLRIIGQASEKAPIMSFVLDHIQPIDFAVMLDGFGMTIRAGDHRAIPIMDFYGISATSRISFAMYNTKAEIDGLMQCIDMLNNKFKI